MWLWENGATVIISAKGIFIREKRFNFGIYKGLQYRMRLVLCENYFLGSGKICLRKIDFHHPERNTLLFSRSISLEVTSNSKKQVRVKNMGFFYKIFIKML